MTQPAADVVVVAAGRSTRMNGIDKLDVPIGGRPLLDWTVAAFSAVARIDRIVVVAAPERIDRLRGARWLPAAVTVVAGGGRRQESVAAGVAEIEARGAPPDRIVLIHDGARPAVRPELVLRVIDAVHEHGAAIPVVPIAETVKRVQDGRIAGTIAREDLGLAQTPQGVRLDILSSAYARFPPSGAPEFTDEAGLLEACTIPIHVVPGQLDNLKVTVPADLGRAAATLGAERTRVGYGEDVHPFGPGEPLVLGGVEIPGAPRLHGHSDGDVVLHAVAGALLGAAGLDDLGLQFPADERTPRGIASGDLLAGVVDRVRRAGFAPVRVDITIVGARPRLADHLGAMRSRVAELASVRPDDVSVKASTANLADSEGAGRAISARAVATVEARPS
jgi:2-C-methyl-D-erythritol 4-phosphate cytidylyltransferase / 2-C-methyl-D-erythritol 2,4-cyclodiphosphate synthase